jgi:hypothetical protein
VNTPATLERLERIVDASGVAARIEALLPVGVRPRQLRVRTLLTGMLLVAVAGRPAHLVRVHQALLALAADEQQRLGIIADWKTGPHLLSYRQTERTFGLVITALSKHKPDGSPSELLSETLDRLLEANVTVLGEPASSSYAVDWTDHETWSRPPSTKRSQRESAEPAERDPEQATPSDSAQGADPEQAAPEDDNERCADPEQAAPEDDNERCADPEAAWGHRRGNHPGHKDELFYGYYLQAATIVKDEHGPQVPELVRRMLLTSCDRDPPRALVPVLERMVKDGIELGDLLADSGYSYRVAPDWALPVRQLGARLIQDLHPNDRGPNGTHMGATCCNGRLYCPATPNALLQLQPLARGASAEQTAAHDRLCDELHRYKLGTLSTHDPDGYHRVICPAAQGKLRCPLRPQSMTLPHTRPQVLTPPEHPTRLLPATNDHRAARRQREDRPETRLPIGRAPHLLQPTHRRRADLLNHQRPRHQRHLTRLVPNHGTHPDRPVHRHRPDRPQPPHPRRLRRPPSRERPTSRQQAPTQATQTPPTHHRTAHHHGQRTTMTRGAIAREPTTKPSNVHPKPGAHPAPPVLTPRPTRPKPTPTTTTTTPSPAAQTASPPTSDANVKIIRGQT